MTNGPISHKLKIQFNEEEE